MFCYIMWVDLEIWTVQDDYNRPYPWNNRGAPDHFVDIIVRLTHLFSFVHLGILHLSTGLMYKPTNSMFSCC